MKTTQRIGAWWAFLAIASVMLTLLGTPSPGSAVETPPAETPDVTAPNGTVAMQKARDLDLAVENLSARTQTRTVFAMPDGTWKIDASPVPVRVQSEEGSWETVNTDITVDGSRLTPTAVPYELTISTGGTDSFVTYRPLDLEDGTNVPVNEDYQDGNGGFELAWPSKLASPVVKDNTVTFADAAPDADLIVTALSNGFRYDVVLHERPSLGVATEFPVNILKASDTALNLRTDGSIDLAHRGVVTATAPRPMMYDNSWAERLTNASEIPDPQLVAPEPLDVVIDEAGDGTTLVLKPDADFLHASTTQYPVTLDPAFMTGTSDDTTVYAGGTYGSEPTDQLQVGETPFGLARSFLKFDPELFDGVNAAAITGADLELRGVGGGLCADSQITAERVTSPWSSSTVTWANQPTVTSVGAATATARADDLGCDWAERVNFDVLDTVRAWATTPSAVHGLRLTADIEDDTDYYKSFGSRHYHGLTPTLSFYVNHPPVLPTDVAVSPSVGDVASGEFVTGVLRPAFLAKVSDPDDQSITPRIRIKRGATTIVETNLPVASSGDVITYRHPTNFQEGDYTFEWRVTAGADTTAWSSPLALEVDLSYPGTAEPVFTTVAPLTVSDCVGTCEPGFWISGSPTPTISTTATDPDSPRVTHEIKLYNDDDDAYEEDDDAGTTDDVAIWHASKTVAQGAPATWVLPAGVLEQGSEYYVRATVTDGADRDPILTDQHYISLTINDPPAYPSSLELTPCESDCSTFTSTSLEPRFTAAAHDPDDTFVEGHIEIRSPGSTSLLHTASKSSVPSEGEAAFAIPIGVLSPGSSYQVRIGFTDPQGLASWGGWMSFDTIITGPAEAGPLQVSPCDLPCGELATQSTTPTLSAENRDSTSRTMTLELTDSYGEVQVLTSPNIQPGANASWIVDLNDETPGLIYARVGVTGGTTTRWTADATLRLSGTASTDGFPANEIQPPNSLPEDVAPYSPDPALDADSVPVPPLTEQEIEDLLDDGSSARRSSEPLSRAEVAAKYWPVVDYHPGETGYPMSATAFLNNSKLKWFHKKCRELADNYTLTSNINWERLATGDYEHLEGTTAMNHPGRVICKFGDKWWQSNKDRVEPFSTGGPSKREGMALDLANDKMLGSEGANNPVYYQMRWKKWIQFWFLSGQSSTKGVVHEGDWERIAIKLNDENRAVKVTYYHHRRQCQLKWGKVPRWGAGVSHPHVQAAQHSHGSYPFGSTTATRRHDVVHVDAVGTDPDNTWYTGNNLRHVNSEGWFGFEGGWGKAQNFGFNSGPEGPSTTKPTPIFGSDVRTCGLN